jgi:trehalose 6-phosphate synthase/phosphatase
VNGAITTEEHENRSTHRLLIVSNRLPVTARVNGDVVIERSSGGLASGLAGPHERSGGLWIGWPGEAQRLKASAKGRLDSALRELSLVPVHLTRREIREFYDRVSNGVLWPVFQYFLDDLPLELHGWDTYRSVNAKFADAIVRNYRPGDMIWVQDYHLLLVPALVRERLPDARIGFFLHIPFPDEDVFSVLPWREEILEGMLGADLIGFHTERYLRHFASALARNLGLEPGPDAVRHGERVVRLGAFPIGIDAAAWERTASDASVEGRAAQIKREARGRSILLGVDRLDYTKGILRRLTAFQRLLEREPSLREQVRLIQVTVPSRQKTPAYEAFKRRVDELVGRINGSFATADSVPIHQIYRSLDQNELAALYRAADVMLVTSLRDGMNLVAKEFVASRTDEDGTLVLSEFAGAAEQLAGALVINPYDVEAIAATIERALAISGSERSVRMRSMRERVRDYDVHRWTASFLAMLEETGGREAVAGSRTFPGERGLVGASGRRE